MREAKDNLDSTLQHILRRHMQQPLLCWYMHTNGAEAHAGSVHLANTGLYLAIHEAKIHFPRNLQSLQEFKKEFVLLASMVFNLERNALMIKKSMDLLSCRKDSTMSRNVDPDTCLDANSRLSSIRPTYYDPPRGQVSLAVLPAGLFGTASTKSTPSLSSPPHRTNLESDLKLDLEPDEYGWVAMDSGSCYNVYVYQNHWRSPSI